MDAVQFNDGELRQYEHEPDGSHKKVFVHFCPSCGTTMGPTFQRWPDVRVNPRECCGDPNAVELTLGRLGAGAKSKTPRARRGVPSAGAPYQLAAGAGLFRLRLRKPLALVAPRRDTTVRPPPRGSWITAEMPVAPSRLR